MANEETCRTCRYWRAVDDEFCHEPYGRCWRYPPTVVGGRYQAEWTTPITQQHDRCGEYASGGGR